MRLLALITTLLFSQLSISQDLDLDYGDVSKADFELKANDSLEHDALFIYRNIDVTFRFADGVGFVKKHEVHERIKIINEAGIEYATQQIRLWTRTNQKREVLKGLKGATYNLLDGEVKRTKLRNSGSYDEILNENWKLESFTMPDVRIGSVIEYKYYIDSPFVSVDDINLQKNVPVLKQDIRVQLVEFYTYNVLLNPRANYIPKIDRTEVNGSIKFNSKATSTSRNTIVSSYDSNKINTTDVIISVNTTGVPALEAEPMSGDLENFRAKLIIELAGSKFPGVPIRNFATTWEDISRSVLESKNFGEQLELNKHFKKDLEKLNVSSKTDQQKVSDIFQFVKNKVKWNGYYGKFTKDGVEDVYENGAGNVAEINLTLIAMLRDVGLDANPVLVSSRGNGIPIFPTSDGFNYVIAHVELDSEEVLLDATDVYSAPNLLPVRATNWQGRLIKKNGSSTWINLNHKKQSRETKMLMVKLEDDLTLTGKVQQQLTDFVAYDLRTKNARKQTSDIIKYLVDDNLGLEIENLETLDLNNVFKPVTLKYDVTYSQGVDEVGDKVYISPLLFQANEENLFKRETRNLPVDLLFPFKYTYIVNMEIPEGYDIESLPEGKKLVYGNDVGSYTLMIQKNGNILSSRAIFEMKETIIIPLDYQAWRNFYIDIVDLDAERIVLKRSDMSIKKSQEQVDQWIKEHGVRYFNELTNMAQLTEEVGEVARIIARRYGEQSEKESDKNKDLGEELADVMFVVLCLANQTGTDLEAAFNKKLQIKTERDHDRHHNNEKLK